jgi:hypothetical protein
MKKIKVFVLKLLFRAVMFVCDTLHWLNLGGEKWDGCAEYPWHRVMCEGVARMLDEVDENW